MKIVFCALSGSIVRTVGVYDGLLGALKQL
jgi:hypothetical protein